MDKTTTIYSKARSFDDRIVDFSVIHNHKEKDWLKFLEVIDAQPGETILCGMDGYGAVSSALMERCIQQRFVPEIYILDESPVQIERARQNVQGISPESMVLADMRSTPFRDAKFDRVVIKMGIHEVPKQDQYQIMREVFRILKPGGKFITWDLSFHDSETQLAFQEIIRQKDRLAKFDSLVANRYFPRQDELLDEINQAGFVNAAVVHEVDAQLTMRVREPELVSRVRREWEQERGQLNDSEEDCLQSLGELRCNKLISFVKRYMASASQELRDKFQYEELPDDVRMVPNKEILVAYKPL